jgi:hypothetical protein
MKLIVVLLLLLSPILSAPSPPTDSADGRQAVSLGEISRLLGEGDDPDQLAVYLDGRLLSYSPAVAAQLQRAIRLHRPGSFRHLFDRTTFLAAHRYNYNTHITDFLGLAVWEHQPEICEYLLGIAFQIDGYSTCFWAREPFPWTIEELVELVRRHPRFAAFTAPRRGSMAAARSLEAATRMLDFAEQLQAFDNGFLGSVLNQPTALLEGLVENQRLPEEAMIVLFSRLFQLGAVVDNGIINLFALNHPNHQDAQIALMAATQETDIKEPAECQQ